MTIDSVTLIYFSPTHTTEQVLEGIARGIGGPVQHIDLTPPSARTHPLPEVREGVAVIGAPVYAGRIPLEAALRIQRLRADGVPTVIVAVYGNREYEDALLELRDIAVDAGFVPVAGAAFIGEHSYDSSQTPIATGRPDQADLRAAEAFGRAVRVKVDGLAPPYGPPELRVPGNSPYRERHKEDVGAPTTLEELCTRCGECVLACPTGAIDAYDPSKTDESACIFCAACVKACPEEARIWEVEWIRQVSRWLADNYSVRKEPEVYL